MTKRALLLLTLAGMLITAAPANAAYIVGLGDQSPGLFQNKLWKDLKLKKVRYLVPYNVTSDAGALAEATAYLKNAKKAKQEVLVHFTARRGCFVNGKYLKTTVCKAPTVKKYTKAVKAFEKKFKYIKTYGAWNEANSPSQPVYKKPKLAAQYAAALQKSCKTCKVVAGDLLDDLSSLKKYAKAMNKQLKGKAKIWGLHNYGDVNRKRTKGTVTMLKIVPGQVWLTETGGIVKFVGSKLNPTEAKAVKAIKFMFTLAGKYDSKKAGHKSKITRLYPYDFGPSSATARFDASLLAPDGTPRKTYTTFKAIAKNKKKR